MFNLILLSIGGKKTFIYDHLVKLIYVNNTQSSIRSRFYGPIVTLLFALFLVSTSISWSLVDLLWVTRNVASFLTVRYARCALTRSFWAPG